MNSKIKRFWKENQDKLELSYDNKHDFFDDVKKFEKKVKKLDIIKYAIMCNPTIKVFLINGSQCYNYELANGITDMVNKLGDNKLVSDIFQIGNPDNIFIDWTGAVFIDKGEL